MLVYFAATLSFVTKASIICFLVKIPTSVCNINYYEHEKLGKTRQTEAP